MFDILWSIGVHKKELDAEKRFNDGRTLNTSIHAINPYNISYKLSTFIKKKLYYSAILKKNKNHAGCS